MNAQSHFSAIHRADAKLHIGRSPPNVHQHQIEPDPIFEMQQVFILGALATQKWCPLNASNLREM